MIESQSFKNNEFHDITRFIDYYMDLKDEIYVNAKILINPNKIINIENNYIKIIIKDTNKVEYYIKNANIKQLHINKTTLYYCAGRDINIQEDILNKEGKEINYGIKRYNSILLDKNISIIESKLPFFE